ncbi:hypothetical protein E2C01_052115 [Portunus trituberculatus]|uniref:Uncharacterized protein n=1 Tax=Portunus trituberculatus TaxID=210409 RepID=A0A5B7GCS4_PORTR|nr:hypothetical protein [Portunus trituberculatus]
MKLQSIFAPYPLPHLPLLLILGWHTSQNCIFTLRSHVHHLIHYATACISGMCLVDIGECIEAHVVYPVFALHSLECEFEVNALATCATATLVPVAVVFLVTWELVKVV